jgi:hypothetical protein
MKRSKAEITPESYLDLLKKNFELFRERAKQLQLINLEASKRYIAMRKIVKNELDETKKFIKKK